MMELGESFPLQPTPIPVKMQFITQKVQQYPGDTLIKYHAALCGGCQFDGHTARFAINLVNSPWDDDLGDTITVTAKDSTGHILATNLVGNSLPVPDFNFSYHVKFGDLYFEAKTGASPAFVFTLSLSFDLNTTTAADATSCTPRWQMSDLEYADMKNRTKGNDEGQLVPIFKTQTSEVVTTGSLQFLALNYCFGGLPHYNITITVLADDQKSGFATYACKKTYNQGKCNIHTPYRDISGGPANFVEVRLNGPQDYGTVTVIVRGDGRYNDLNKYTLAASAPY